MILCYLLISVLVPRELSSNWADKSLRTEVENTYLSKSSIEFPLLIDLIDIGISLLDNRYSIVTNFYIFSWQVSRFLLPLNIDVTEAPKYAVRLGKFHIHCLGTSIGL